MKSNYSLNLTNNLPIYQLDFQEKNLNLDRDLNHSSARLEIWRSVVQMPVQVQIFFLENLIIIGSLINWT